MCAAAQRSARGRKVTGTAGVTRKPKFPGLTHVRWVQGVTPHSAPENGASPRASIDGRWPEQGRHDATASEVLESVEEREARVMVLHT